MIVSVSVVLGVMVLVHEWGHFIVAKAFGVRVEIFSIGFGSRLWGTKRGDTDYRISALPLGGYVKMAGDNPLEDRKGDPDEFLSKPRWQRVLIALAGPAMNIVLSIVLVAGIYMRGSKQPVFLDQPMVLAGVLADSSRAEGRPGPRRPHHQGKRRQQSNMGSRAIRVDVDLARAFPLSLPTAMVSSCHSRFPPAHRLKMYLDTRRIDWWLHRSFRARRPIRAG